LCNNILYNYHPSHGSIDFDAASMTGLKSDYNIVMDRLTADDNTTLSLAAWRAATGQDVHSAVATPAQLFVNPAGNDYHLLATCAAVDKGTSQDAPAKDIEDMVRPQGKGWDIGAYEWRSGTGQVVNRIDSHAIVRWPKGMTIVDLRGRVVAADGGSPGRMPFAAGYYVEMFETQVGNKGRILVKY
jgi:hypothetical protein